MAFPLSTADTLLKSGAKQKAQRSAEESTGPQGQPKPSWNAGGCALQCTLED